MTAETSQEVSNPITHLANEQAGDELRTLCGRTKPRIPFVEIPERLCKTCDRIATKELGEHRHWMWCGDRYKLKWPTVVWVSGMPACCDLMQSSGSTTHWLMKVQWAS